MSDVSRRVAIMSLLPIPPITESLLQYGTRKMSAPWYRYFKQQDSQGKPRPPKTVLDFGAVGDGIEDDTEAFQAAADSFAGDVGGAVYVPTPPLGGFYKITSQIEMTKRGVGFVGDGMWQPTVVQFTEGQHGFVFKESQQQIARLNVGLPYSVSAGNTGFSISNQAGADSIIDQCILTGGFGGVDAQGGADLYITRCKIYSCYGNALIVGGAYIFRCKLDPNYSVSTPLLADLRGAWAPNTAYDVGNMVTIVQDDISWRIQCSQSGISGSSQPTVLPMAEFNDGTAKWYWSHREGLAAFHYTASYSAVGFCDMEGALDYGVASNNPSQWLQFGPNNNIRRTVAGGLVATHADIYEYNVFENTINGVVDGPAVSLAGGSNVRINNNALGSDNGNVIEVGRGRGAVNIIGNNCATGPGICIDIAAGLEDFRIDGNICVSDRGTAIKTRADSDWYHIVNNNVRRSAIGVDDGANGANKVVTGNL